MKMQSTSFYTPLHEKEMSNVGGVYLTSDSLDVLVLIESL